MKVQLKCILLLKRFASKTVHQCLSSKCFICFQGLRHRGWLLTSFVAQITFFLTLPGEVYVVRGTCSEEGEARINQGPTGIVLDVEAKGGEGGVVP